MDAYSSAKSGKLVLKGDKKTKGKKRRHDGSSSKKKVVTADKTQDALDHDGWWCLKDIADVTGSVAIEIVSTDQEEAVSEGCYYLAAQDNGLFTVGPPRPKGEGPAPEEIFTIIKISESKIAMKSGYGKYLAAGIDGLITAMGEAVGPREHWEPVFDDGKTALLGANCCFLSIDPSKGDAVCVHEKAGSQEMIEIRCNRELDRDPKLSLPQEERDGLIKAEVNYVKKFQSWQDRRLRLSKEETTSLKKAKVSGDLYECLLDRREKMKADRYCK